MANKSDKKNGKRPLSKSPKAPGAASKRSKTDSGSAHVSGAKRNKNKQQAPATVSTVPIFVHRVDNAINTPLVNVQNADSNAEYAYRGGLPHPFPRFLSNSDPPAVRRFVEGPIPPCPAGEVVTTGEETSARAQYRQLHDLQNVNTVHNSATHNMQHVTEETNRDAVGRSYDTMMQNLRSSTSDIGEHSKHVKSSAAVSASNTNRFYPDLEPVSPAASDVNNRRMRGSPQQSTSSVAPALHERIHLLSQFEAEEEFGPPVSQFWAEITSKAFNTRLSKEALDTMNANYKRPENVPVAQGPKLDSFVYKDLPSFARKKDGSLLQIQSRFADVTTPLLRAIEMVDGGEEELDREYLLDHLSHALTFLGNAQCHVSTQRREELRNHVDTKYGDIFNRSVVITDKLLGDDVEKKVKEMKAVTDIQPMRRTQQQTSQSQRSFRAPQKQQWSQNKRGSNQSQTRSTDWQQSRYQARGSGQSKNGQFRGRGRGRGQSRPPPWAKKY